MKKDFKLLTAPGFLIALSLLLANDFLFKPAFHSALTGKLSDFAGLFAFALFWSALFPRRKRLIHVAIVISFVFWKSGLSQPLISWWNSLPLFRVGRTIDYSDLVALFVLPLAYVYSEAKPRAALSFRFAPHAVAMIALFAFVATSPPNTRRAEASRTYTFNFSKEQLLARLNNAPGVRASFLGESSEKPISLRITYQFKFCDSDDLRATALVSETQGGGSALERLRVEYMCGSQNAPEDDRHVLDIFEREVLARVDENQLPRPASSSSPSATTMPMLRASPEN